MSTDNAPTPPATQREDGTWVDAEGHELGVVESSSRVVSEHGNEAVVESSVTLRRRTS